ncbi:hypothetical protein GC096_04150 [Paenibacillus sp. LMG 31461]|uniref:ADP-heptose:LPS heptosyltransferase n=1 Tax=Paenibacillus plantarum TaxID=2654975 RepID=A0ABX1X499_9BACL|nr:hypothetical protein [Paenibacillus plantarum]NOU63238.1 hypothetical protein [Paenibacillus plantarum]
MNLLDQKINNLKMYRNYLKNRKTLLIVVHDKYIEITFQILTNLCKGRILILEVYNCKEVYEYYKRSTTIHFVNSSSSVSKLSELIITKKYENSDMIDDNYNYRFAFLVDASEGYQRFSYLIGQELPKDYECSDYAYIGNSKKEYLIFGKNKRNIHSKKVAILTGMIGGYGDIICSLPILQYFIDSIEYPVDVLCSTQSVYDIYSNFIHRAECKLIEINDSIFDFLDLRYNKQGQYIYYYSYYYLFSINNSFTQNNIHFAELIHYTYNLDKSINDILSSYKLAPNHNTDKKYLTNLVDSLKKEYRYVISIQFFTSTEIFKNWPEAYALRFIELCKANGIAIINVAPCMYKYENIIDISLNTFYDIYHVISKVDLHVGIDSSFGHMAAMSMTKSLTIWCGHGPLWYPVNDGVFQLSYRALRLNYSVYDEGENKEKITPEIIYSIMCNILDEKIELKNDFISYDDSVNGVNCYITTN